MGGPVCHQLGFLSEEREDRKGRKGWWWRQRTHPAEWATAGGDPRMLEEVEAGVNSGPHTGWGGWLPPHCPPCTLPVPGLGVGSWGLPVTGCPLGID